MTNRSSSQNTYVTAAPESGSRRLHMYRTWDARHPRSAFFLDATLGMVVLGSGFVLGSVSATLSLFGFYTLFVIALHNRKSFDHPIAVFALFYFPYSSWYAIYCLVTGEPVRYEELNQSLLLALVGLVSYVLVCQLVLCYRRPRQKLDTAVPGAGSPSILTTRILLSAALVVVLLAVASVSFGGLDSKRAILDADLAMVTASGFAAVILAVGVLFIFMRSTRPSLIHPLREPWLNAAVVVLVLGFLVLGERDYIFRLGFCGLVVLGAFRKLPGIRFYLTLIAAFILILPVTQAAKALLVSGGDGFANLGWDKLFVGEFISASRNNYMLVHFGVEQQPWFFLTDVVRGLVPFTQGAGLESAASWYGSTFRVMHGFSGTSGWGFSLAGEGFIFGGYPGVALIMAFAAFMISILYRLRLRSHYWLVFYAFALASLIYAIRADLANLLSGIFKVGGLAVLAFFVVEMILRAVTRIARLSRMRAV